MGVMDGAQSRTQSLVNNKGSELTTWFPLEPPHTSRGTRLGKARHQTPQHLGLIPIAVPFVVFT